jgi:hypothetical protein
MFLVWMPPMLVAHTCMTSNLTFVLILVVHLSCVLMLN